MQQKSPPFTFLVFAFALVIIITVAILLVPAWTMVDSLVHPRCTEPVPLSDFDTAQEHWLETVDGYSIRIWYYPSQNGSTILSFGGVSGGLGNRLPPVNALLQAGYGIVQVDTRACARPVAEVTLGGNEVFDGQAALDFLLAQAEVDPQRIGAIGFSLGGATAIRLAAVRPEIHAVVRDGGFTNLGELFHPPNITSFLLQIHHSAVLTFYSLQTGLDAWEISPGTDIASLSPRPVLLIYGEAEASGGQAQYATAGEPKTLWVVPGGRHGVNHLVAPAEYDQHLLDFFGQALLP